MANGTPAMQGQKSEVLLQLEIEKSKLNREKSLLLLDKSLLMYFAFLIIGVVGFVNKYLDARYLNIMIALSFGVLAVGLVPYMLTMSREEKKLNALIINFRSNGSGSGNGRRSKATGRAASVRATKAAKSRS
ncbi:hypothetical protein HYU16_01650 [Candidatus Woesearchaeota archaeon]|nr:hypothetical protein [Candidatus Woesearchaeota archaeon]